MASQLETAKKVVVKYSATDSGSNTADSFTWRRGGVLRSGLPTDPFDMLPHLNQRIFGLIGDIGSPRSTANLLQYTTVSFPCPAKSHTVKSAIRVVILTPREQIVSREGSFSTWETTRLQLDVQTSHMYEESSPTPQRRAWWERIPPLIYISKFVRRFKETS